MEAIFDLSRDELLKRVQAGKMQKMALAAHDYVFDIFEEKQRSAAKSLGKRSA